MSERFGNDLLLIDKLAAGGMAEVHRAKQLGYGGFEKAVAVKRILPNFASNEEFKSMFRMEANLSAMLQHPNVVHIYTNGEFDGYLYLVMEFIDGRNLRQMLARADKKKVKIPIEIACHIVGEAAKGLEYAHNFIDEKTGQALEIVHRDMSPQNVMVSYDGHVKIVDFGIAKAAARAENTRAGVLKGKFGYMSPEQAQGMKIDKRTDIFALGIILFETLTQRRLFTCDDDLRTLSLVKECRVPRPSKYNPSIGPNLDRIVMKALAKEKGERYANAQELYTDLLRFMNQKYPKFVPTELSGFLKKLFAEDIVEDKKRREKLAAEAPPRLASAAPRAQAQREPEASKDEGHTQFEEGDDKTQVSQNGAAPAQSLPPPASPQQLMPDLEGQGHTDPGLRAAQLDMPEASPFGGEKREDTNLTPPDIGLPPPNGGDQVRSAFPSGGGPSHLSISIPGASPTRPPMPRASTPAGRMTLENISSDQAGTNIYQMPQAAPAKFMNRKRLYMYAGAVLTVFVVIALSQQPSGGNVVANVDPVKENPKQTKDPVAVASSVPEAVDPIATLPPVETALKTPVDLPPDPVSPVTPPPSVPPPQVVVAPPVDPVTPPPVQPIAPVQPIQPDHTARDTASLPSGDEFEAPKENAAAGYLSLVTVPKANEIYVDGKLLRDAAGKALQTPLASFRVSPGPHRITLKNTFFGVQAEETVKIEKDRILKRDLLMKK